MSSVRELITGCFSYVPHKLLNIAEFLNEEQAPIKRFTRHQSEVFMIRCSRISGNGDPMITVNNGFLMYKGKQLKYELCVVMPTYVCFIDSHGTFHYFTKDEGLYPVLIEPPKTVKPYEAPRVKSYEAPCAKGEEKYTIESAMRHSINKVIYKTYRA